ncbi:hypothetical protein Tco_1268862 [Tanacetum coccineum]
MNREVGRFNSLENETNVLSGENDDDWMKMVQIIRNQGRVTEDEPELTGDDELPRLPDKQRILKLNDLQTCTPLPFSNPTMFQEMIQEQYTLDRAAKMERLDRETSARVELINAQKKSEDFKVLAINTSGMNPIGAAIINVEKKRIRDFFQPQG